MSFVPSHIFSKEWLGGNFTIPAEAGVRTELRRQLELASHYGVMHLEKNAETKNILTARLAALQEYERVMMLFK